MSGTDAVRRGVPLTDKVIAQVHELHERTLQLERDAGAVRGRKARSGIRSARDEESDLLRVLGFDSYRDFTAVAGEPEAPPPTGDDELVLDELELAAAADPDARPSESQRAEDDLVRILREPDVDADVHARIAAFEEDLAQARFELRALRDETRARDSTGGAARAARDDASADASVADESAAFVAAMEELESLCELLRIERAELVRLTEQARADAERVRDVAGAEARAVLDEARTAAVALTRDALMTIDGLLRLATERDEPGDSGPAGP